METTQTTSRIHPLLAGAAVSVTLVSLLGVAALSGMLPNSNSSGAPLAQTTPAPVLVQTQAGLQYMQPVSAPIAAAYQVEPATPPAHKHAATVRRTSSHQTTYAQNENNYRNDNRQPAYQQPNYQQPVQAANSPIGIATGAVVGGLIGNQVGGGRGRALATVAGAVGGGFLGNMAGQKYGY